MAVFQTIFSAVALALLVGTSRVCYSQPSQLRADEAITLAKRYQLKHLSFFYATNPTRSCTANFDSLSGTWIVNFTKIRYRNFGREQNISANGKQRGKKCRTINGCYVVKGKHIVVDATRGKVLTVRKTKRKAGCYE